ncbi:MAG TPA: phage terminase small subunit P27 family [Phycisphaerae bacterium]|nr:phage terminase small subunit P27 family [Phycisphaerae bacterium]
MKGRKPIPTKIKLLRGNPGKRRLNAAEPQVPISMPEMPSWLDKTGRAEWERVGPLLHRVGVLSRVDAAALAGYCAAFSVVAKAMRSIGRDGIHIGAAGEAVRRNPACTTLNQALAQMRAYMVELGLTPSARTRLTVVTPEAKDALEEFLPKLSTNAAAG